MIETFRLNYEHGCKYIRMFVFASATGVHSSRIEKLLLLFVFCFLMICCCFGVIY